MQARRLALFCDAYGLDSADRAMLVATVARRATALQELMVTLAASGDPAGQARLWEGHADLYAADVRYLLAEEAALGAEL